MKPIAAVLVLALAAQACSKTPDQPTPDASTSDVATPDASTPDASMDTGSDTSGPPDMAPDLGSDADMGVGCTYAVDEPESIPTPTRVHTPRWAFRPWISKDISDTADTYAFVDGFRDRDIPVGTVVLDSPWATNYNTFIPSPTRYPDFGQMVSDMRSRNVRVVLWVTQFTNEASFDLERGGDLYDGPASNYAEAKACNFFINDGRLYTWWKGRGGSIDFFNSVAAQWWHEQQAPLLDLGIAGWKLDFGESYVRTDTVTTAAGEISHQAYSERYYQDYYEYGLSRRGDEEFVTMVRAWDESYDLPGRFFARPEHAPVVWVGDNRRDWVGLEDALDHTFRSAVAGYTVIGSDLGGYLNRDDMDLGVNIPFDRTNFMRWLAMSAMTPFMQLHGRENLTPWTLPNDTDVDESVALYRFWSHLHSELVPFWYSLAQESYAGNVDGIIRPIGDEADWAGDYRYMLGDAFLVAPILDATGIRDVEVPAGTWRNFWTDELVVGGTTATFDYSGSLREIPILVKSGAIIPIESSSSVTGLTEGSLGAADVVLAQTGSAPTNFRTHDPDGATTDYLLAPGQFAAFVRFTASRALRPLVARIRYDVPIGGVTVNGVPATEVTTEAELLAGGRYRVAPPYVWVSSGVSDQPVEFRVTTQ